MEYKKIIKKYEKESGKRAIVDGKETIGFKRWAQYNKFMYPIIKKNQKDIQKDFYEIIKTYLKSEEKKITKNKIEYILEHYYFKTFMEMDKIQYMGKLYDNLLEKKSLTINKSVSNLLSIRGLFKLKCLEYLSFHNNNVEYVPPKINKLINLRTLNLAECKLREIPKEIGDLTYLKELHLQANALRNLPESIGNLKNLEYLQIGANKLGKIPKCIKRLSELRKLWIYANGISNIPKWIGDLRELRELVISNNKIRTLPKSIKNLQNLSILHIDKNNIDSFPQVICELPNLIELAIDDKIKLPDCITNNEKISLW